MKGLYGTGSTTARVHKSHRILYVGGRVQLSSSLSTGSKHSCGLRPRHFSVFQVSKNYPLFLSSSLNQSRLPEAAVYSVRLQQGGLSQVGSDLNFPVFTLTNNSQRKLDEYTQFPEAVLVLKYYFVVLHLCLLSFILMTILEVRYYNLPGIDKEKAYQRD